MLWSELVSKFLVTTSLTNLSVANGQWWAVVVDYQSI